MGNKIIVFILSLFFSAILYSSKAQQNIDVRYTVMMNDSMLRKIYPDIHLLPFFDINPLNLIVLADSSNFYTLGINGIIKIPLQGENSIASFSYTNDQYLFVVNSHYLQFLNTDGTLKTIYELPYKNMKIFKGQNAMYLVETSNTEKDSYALYVFNKNGLFGGIFAFPDPIEAIAEYNNNILFSSKNALFTFNPKTIKFEALAKLNDNETIISITTDPVNYLIFFATPYATYILRPSGLALLTDKLGGKLIYKDNHLYIFDYYKNLILEISNLDKFKF